MRGNRDRVSGAAALILHPLQRSLLRLYSLLLFLGRCNRFLLFTFLFFSTFFSLVFILFFSGITVALATGSKPGISTHLVPSELKLDGGGEGESIRVRVRSQGGECALLVVDPDGTPSLAAPFRLGGGAGRSASESSSTRTSSSFSLPTGASSESELDSKGVILMVFVEVDFLGDAAFDFGFSFFLFLFFVAFSSLNLRLSHIHFLLHPRTCVPLCCLHNA